MKDRRHPKLAQGEMGFVAWWGALCQGA